MVVVPKHGRWKRMIQWCKRKGDRIRLTNSQVDSGANLGAEEGSNSVGKIKIKNVVTTRNSDGIWIGNCTGKEMVGESRNEKEKEVGEEETAVKGVIYKQTRFTLNIDIKVRMLDVNTY
jgi:hypothetical protein